MAVKRNFAAWSAQIRKFISLNDILGIWMITLGWRFHSNCFKCKVDLPENEKAFCVFAANKAISILLIIFGVLFIIALSNFAYIRLHVRAFMVCVMWYAHQLVVEFAIKCGESFQYRYYVSNVASSLDAIEHKFEYRIFSDSQIVNIMECIKISLYLCDELFLLTKITLLLVLFELFIEPFLTIALRAIFILYKVYSDASTEVTEHA